MLMKRKIMSIVMCICMLLTLLPTTIVANTQDEKQFWRVKVGSIELSDGQCITANNAGEATDGNNNGVYVAYFKDGTLYLNNLTVNNGQIKWYARNAENAIIAFDLTIDLTGDNTVTNNNGTAILGETGWVTGRGMSLTIQGNGSLEATGTRGFWVWKDINIKGNTQVTVSGTNGQGICNNSNIGKITIAENAEVVASGTTYGVGYDNNYSDSTIQILSGSLEATGDTAAFRKAAVFGDNVSTQASESDPNNSTIVEYNSTNNEAYKWVKVTYPHTHCVCGGNAVGVGDHTQCENITWTAWGGSDMDSNTDGIQLTTGNYYLTNDIESTGSIQIVGDVKLCLNGKTITINEDDLELTDGATLSICDCTDTPESTSDGGKIAIISENVRGIGILCNTSYTLSIYGGNIISENGISIRTSEDAPGSAINIYGGMIKGLHGISTDTTHDSSINIMGGTIQGDAYGIEAYDVDMNISGGTIIASGGDAIWLNYGSRLYLSGNPIISGDDDSVGEADIFVSDSSIIVKRGLSTENPISIGSAGANLTITPDGESITSLENYVGKFTSIRNNYHFVLDGNYLKEKNGHGLSYSATSSVITEYCTCGYSETATIVAPTGDIYYDGTPKQGATVTYSEGWQGGTLAITYSNNTEVGDATAIISKGNATATITFVINKVNQIAPTNLSYSHETIFNKADGSIDNLTSNMEYRKEGESTYKKCVDLNSSTLENLAPGKYYVRYVADATHNASPDREIVIAAGRKLTVTYKADGVTVFTQEVGYGMDATAPAIPEKDGYEETAPTWDKDGKNITADTIINAVYTKNIPGEYTDKTPETNVGSGKVTETVADLKDKVEFTEEELDEIEKGADVEIWLEVKDNSQAVSTADKTLVSQKAESGTVGIHLDINMYKKVGAKAPQKLTQLVEKVTVTMKVPSNLLNMDSKVTRTYFVVRVHNGVAEKLNTVFDKTTNMVSFETDCFSTYALVYSDTSETPEKPNEPEVPSTPEVPDTGDHSSVFLCLMLLFVGVGAMGFGIRRKNTK